MFELISEFFQDGNAEPVFPEEKKGICYSTEKNTIP